MIHECVKSAVLGCDFPLSVEVSGKFSIEGGHLRFTGVDDAISVFYTGQAIQILHHVRTIMDVDLVRGLLSLNHPLSCITSGDIGDSVFVDPDTRMMLTNGDGRTITSIEKDGAIHSAWMDRLVARVNNQGQPGLHWGVNGWTIEESVNGLRFVNPRGVPCMEIHNDGTLILQ